MPKGDIRRRIMGMVTVMDRNYRINPQTTYWEPAQWPKDDPTINFLTTVAHSAAGTTAIGTFISTSLDTLLGDAALIAGTSNGFSGNVQVTASVNGTMKRRWAFASGTHVMTLLSQGAGPFDNPILRVPAGGTLILSAITAAAGTLEVGFNAFGARY